MLDFPPFSKIQDLKELIHSGLIIVETEAIHVLEQEVEGMSENRGEITWTTFKTLWIVDKNWYQPSGLFDGDNLPLFSKKPKELCAEDRTACCQQIPVNESFCFPLWKILKIPTHIPFKLFCHLWASICSVTIPPSKMLNATSKGNGGSVVK